MSLQQVKVLREEVLKLVQENKEKHDVVLKDAIEGYWLEAETFLKKNEKDRLEQINKNHREQLKKLRKSRKDAIKDIKNATKNDLDLVTKREKDKGFRFWSGKYPEDHGDDYLGTIRRLELSVEPQIELDTNEFDSYIRNKWSWRDSFLGSNTCYVSSFRSYGTGSLASPQAVLTTAKIGFLKSMILGFDASTSTVGWSFYDGTSVVDAGFIDISKLETNKDKAFHVISVIESTPHISEITKINLEAALSGFFMGKTSQQTIIKLARFNAVFEYIISEQWALPVNLISVTTARKTVFGKARVKGMTGKEYVRQQIDSKFSYVHKFDKMNTRGTWDAHNEDTYDAIVISMAG